MVSRVTVANCLNLRGLVLSFYRDSTADFNQGEIVARCCSILLVSTSLFLGWMMTGSICCVAHDGQSVVLSKLEFEFFYPVKNFQDFIAFWVIIKGNSASPSA